MAKGQVILTHGRSLQALVAARSLARQGLRVIGCDHTPMMALSFSKYVAETFLLPDPLVDADAWLDVLQEESWKRQPASGDTPYVLMPMHRNTPLLAAARQRFEPEILVAAPQIEAIAGVSPKQRLVETCRQRDIPIPKTWLITRKDQIDAACEDDVFPKFVKLPDSSGGAGIRQAESANDLRSTCAAMLKQHEIHEDRPLLVQEAVSGRDYCFTGLFDRGRRVASMTYVNDRTFPAEAGAGVLRTTVEDAPFLPAAEKLMQALEWNGVAELDFRWNGEESDTPQLIEVNPRFWSGLFQSIASGVDYPWLLYQQTTGAKVGPLGKVNVGMRTRVPFLDWASALSEWRHDDPGAWKKVTELWDQGKDIPTELISTDDRGAALGALHVVGSLLRFGRLPQQLASSDRGRPAASPKLNDKPRVLVSFDRNLLHKVGLGHYFFRRLLNRSSARMRALRYDESEASLDRHGARGLIESVDGLLLSGGGDVDPKLYGSSAPARNVKPERDRFELALMEQAMRQGKPILGVCRGCQLLNVAFGGTLKDLPTDKRDMLNHWRYCKHPVSIKPESRIGRLVKQKRIRAVRSVHRQAVKQPGDGIRVVARAPDGVIEAIESHRGWHVGVQWHPEWVLFKDEGHRIVDGFVEACQSHRSLSEFPVSAG